MKWGCTLGYIPIYIGLERNVQVTNRGQTHVIKALCVYAMFKLCPMFEWRVSYKSQCLCYFESLIRMDKIILKRIRK